MPVVRPRLFLSSTAEDLAAFRAEVVHVAQRLGADVVAMEEFGPDPRTALQVCREKVQGADVFVGLYAHRYGFVPDAANGTSLTELEYRWALAGRPSPDVLAFDIDPDVPWPPRHVEHGPGWDRLQSFKAELRTRHTVETLTTPEQLREDLFVHLPAFLARAGRDEPDVEATLPRPPEPYVVHPYSLLETRRVLGRRRELDRLDRWFASSTPIACVVAIGGMGKSALTWRWFHEQTEASGGRLWWSFYENQATFDRFVTTTLAYLTGRPPAEVEQASPHDRDQELLAVLDRHDVLIVLDGLERLLIAYSNLDFAHLGDDDLDERTANAVADHLGLPAGFVGRHRLRRTIDVRVGAFLRKMTRAGRGRVLITTRLFPSELQTVAGHPLPGVDAWFLRGLDPDDAIALWREFGVSGEDDQLRALFATIEHYPLLIRALAGEVAHHRAAPGDLDRWRTAHPTFDPFALPLVQAKTHVLAHSVGSLDDDAQDLLHTLAAFRAPVDHASVHGLFATAKGWSDQQLDRLLSGLEDRGLVGWDRSQNTYDLHPIVRGVVWSGLDDVQRRAVYGDLEQHFSDIPDSDEDLTVEEAQPLIELFTALVGLKRYEKAATLWFDRFHTKFNFVGHGMNQVNIALLESLFPEGLDAEPAVKERIGVLAQLSHAYKSAGRLSDAYRFLSRADVDQKGRPYLVSSHYVTADRAFLLGHVQSAHKIAGRAAAAEKKEYKTEESRTEERASYWARATQAVLLAESGSISRALAILRTLQANAYFHPGEHEARVRLLSGDLESASRAVSEARGHFADSRFAYDGVLAVEAEIAVKRIELNVRTPGVDRPDAIVAMVDESLRETRRCGDVHGELPLLLLLARLFLAQGDLGATRSYLDDISDPAERGGYRYHRAEAALVLAEVERAEGDRETAISAARDAYVLAWCDGPPYSYHWFLQRAVALLEDLGAEPTR